MRRAVKVNYPKKRSRINLEDLGDVSEPEKHSMYQVLLENMKIARRATFLHRIIYVGQHRFTSFEEAKDVFGKIITRCNETYCIDKLSGFLLYYQQYVVHMVEGDEDNLNKHLGYLLDKKAPHHGYLGVFKLLIHVSNINQRFFQDWVAYTGTPSKLLEKFDFNTDLAHSGRAVFNCIKKMYAIMSMYAEDMAHVQETQMDVKHPYLSAVSSIESTEILNNTNFFPSLEGISTQGSDRSGNTESGGHYRDYRMFLPEFEVLEFVIKSNFTQTLESYYELYENVPMRDIYKDRVWPVPHDFIPYDVFEKPYECITELPKELRRRDMRLTSSSSFTNASISSLTPRSTILTLAEDAQTDTSEEQRVSAMSESP